MGDWLYVTTNRYGSVSASKTRQTRIHPFRWTGHKLRDDWNGNPRNNRGVAAKKGRVDLGGGICAHANPTQSTLRLSRFGLHQEEKYEAREPKKAGNSTDFVAMGGTHSKGETAVKARTIFIIASFILVFQIALIAVGVYQVQQPDSFTRFVGGFNIVFNAMFGLFNVSTMALMAWIMASDD